MSKKQKQAKIKTIKFSATERGNIEQLFVLARGSMTDLTKQGKKMFKAATKPLEKIEGRFTSSAAVNFASDADQELAREIVNVLDEVYGVREDCEAQVPVQAAEMKLAGAKKKLKEAIKKECEAMVERGEVSGDFVKSFESRKHMPVKEQRKIKTGTWVRVKWLDSQDNAGLVVSNDKEDKGYRILDLKEGGTFGIDYDQVLEVIGKLEEPAIILGTKTS